MLAAVFGDPVLTGGDSPSCFLEMPPRDFFFFLAAYSRWLFGLVRDGSFGLIGYYAYLHLFAMASLAYSLWLIWLPRFLNVQANILTMRADYFSSMDITLAYVCTVTRK